MIDIRECERCGHNGYDVHTKIVQVPDEVMVSVGEYAVPERFRAESRCVDQAACDERLEASR